jgi:hypothetical protein
MQLTYENVRYGMLVEVLSKDGGSYHSGCKVHFFNKKGVLVGNYYEFLPFERLRVREDINGQTRQYPRYFYGKSGERLKTFLFGLALSLTGRLIRITQHKMD